jgi:DNA-binding GntR family transcriptional regulator
MDQVENSGKPGNGSQKLAEVAFDALRRQLLTGALEPGAPLRLERLKRELGIGFTPLREALMRLSSEGLVEVEDIRGFRAAPATLADMEDIMLSRAHVEAKALEQSILLGDVDWEAEIVGNYHRMSRHDPRDSLTGLVSEEWGRAHRDFHLSLISACNSRWLLRFWQILFDQAQRYRHLSVVQGAQYRDDTTEHRAIMDAALNRDLEQAIEASRSHIQSTCAVLRRLMKQ